jgi:Ni,Fe-hydrogenase I cytochrome b subunit
MAAIGVKGEHTQVQIGPEEYRERISSKPVSRHAVEVLYLILVLIIITGMAAFTRDLAVAIPAVGLALVVFAYRVIRIHRDQTN